MPVGDVTEAEDGLREDVGRMINESLGGGKVYLKGEGGTVFSVLRY